MKSKSTITITEEDDGLIDMTVVHDPLPSGKMDNWNMPAVMVEQMTRFMRNKVEQLGVEPVFLKTKNSGTGHVNIISREEQE